MFTGSHVALVTPFCDGKVDYKKLESLIEFQIEAGTSGIVPCGTTGESATLTPEEHNRVVETTVKAAAGRIKVIAGAGSNSTAESISLARHAEKAGADAALVITPYYNKPTPAGLVAHFTAVAGAVEIPIIMYNVPGRTGTNMLPATVAHLAKVKNIVGIKEASGSIDQSSEISILAPGMTILSGDDSLTLPLLSVGARGVISVVANIAPRDVAELVRAYRSGDFETALVLHRKLFLLCKAMFIETNPIPVKTAMRILKRLNGELRLPLCPMEAHNEQKLKKVVSGYDFGD